MNEREKDTPGICSRSLCSVQGGFVIISGGSADGALLREDEAGRLGGIWVNPWPLWCTLVARVLVLGERGCYWKEGAPVPKARLRCHKFTTDLQSCF
jgi:hypothetical protein